LSTVGMEKNCTANRNSFFGHQRPIGKKTVPLTGIVFSRQSYPPLQERHNCCKIATVVEVLALE
ncbi:hypothetical protein, partial [Phormidium sp. CCY1219]|uniref:hypothetical protein n=1 Tax=Phormidium sp. CCY1219 TaxID=2886104 RepID=UPI002D1F625E